MPRFTISFRLAPARFKRFLILRWHLFLRSFTRSEARSSRLFRFTLAGLIGIGAGLVVALLDSLVGWMHRLLFALPADQRLSDASHVDAWRVFALPAIGGLAVGITAWLIKRLRPRDVVDAIEANALFGGRKSVGDSLGLVLLTMLSGGFGASVGLEAAYTQLSAGLGS